MNAQDPHRSASLRAWWPRVAIALQAFIVLAMIAGLAGLWWAANLPQRVRDQDTLVIGQDRFEPDSDGALRVLVLDHSSRAPVGGARVEVSLESATGETLQLYEGRTDASGTAPVSFHLPADTGSEDATLVVETRSDRGRDRVEQAVTVAREYRLLLASDKPLYQPGQTIHMRALALSAFDMAPARGAMLDFLVEDAKGNKVFRQSVVASDYGIAAADFRLADLVNQGNYRLSVALGETTSEATVEVRPYVLPKFRLSVSTDRSFYLPGERVEGAVQADYFFGKPVGQGQVQLVGSAWDVERAVSVDLRGETDANGTYAFSFDLPEYFAGTGLEAGQAQFGLEVTVIDQTDHAEQTSAVLPVAGQPLIIEAAAESGVLKPGIENILYLLTSYPDGQPAATRLQVSVDGGARTEQATDQYGLAELRFTPEQGSTQVTISARDEAGREATRTLTLEADQGAERVLLRADRAAYVVGETMHLVALTSADFGEIYLDIVKAGQTLSTRSAAVVDGQAAFEVDASGAMFGALNMHAYKVLADGTIVRDSRIVVVDAPNDLAIEVQAGNDTYLPGETAQLAFQTRGAGGAGVQTALGLAIVDESVFALRQQDPGFAKLYFMLQQDLLEPRYQIKQFEPPAAFAEDQYERRAAQDAAARARWAGAPLMEAMLTDTHVVKVAALSEAQPRAFGRVANGAGIGLAIIPVLLLAAAVAAMWGTRLGGRALGRTVLYVVGAAILGGLLAFGLVNSLLGRGRPGVVLLIALGAVVVAALVVLFVVGWVRRDQGAQFLALLALAWGVGLIVFFAAQSRPQSQELATGWLIAAVAAALLVPLAYLLFGQTRWIQWRQGATGRAWVGAIATTLGAVAALPIGLLPLVAVATTMSASLAPGVVRQVVVPVEVEVAAPAMEAPEEEPTFGEGRDAVEQEAGAGAEVPRLRQFFPETLYWAPEVVTDEDGFVSLDIPLADSITTWRLTALASSQDGRLGFTTSGLRVFQDFFVDIDLPVALTVGDEVSIPIGVFNYLPQAQHVRLVVEQEPWFELLGDGEQTLTIASNDIEVIYFPVRVREFGRQGFQVTAWGEQMSDAIRREVRVVPDGMEIALSESGWLRESREIELEFPADAIAGTQQVEVKVYPGVLSQVVEGLEKILQLPYG